MQHAIMKVLSSSKSLPLSVLVQNVEEYLLSQNPDSDRKVKASYVIKRTLKKLQESGTIELLEGADPIVAMSDQGNTELRKISLSRGQQLLPTEWDGKWRMVILDFESGDTRIRNAVRYILKKAHFYCLKNSVWVSPYNCEPIIRELQYHMGIGPELLFITAEKIDDAVEMELMEHFGVSRE
jgi:DNA-binding transcriptional regulator PaaX